MSSKKKHKLPRLPKPNADESIADDTGVSRSDAKLGRLTPAIQHTICSALRIGVPAPIAAERAGVDRREFDRWMRWGAAYDDAPGEHPDHVWYSLFRAEITKARAEGAVEMIKVLRTGQSTISKGPDGMPVQWSADTGDLRWLLTKAFREDFTDTQRTEVTGADGGPVKSHITGGVIMLPPEDE